MPYESEAQSGRLALQSTHVLLPTSAASSSAKNCSASAPYKLAADMLPARPGLREPQTSSPCVVAHAAS